MADRPIRTFIYGSCVSRDMLELAEPGEFEIVKYVARQSLLSMSRDASEYWPEGFELESAFQNRMAYEDWKGSVLNQIRQVAKENIDLILWDITDERFGVYKFHNQAIVTRSADIFGSIAEETAITHGEHMELGTVEHLRWWRRLVSVFATYLKDLGVFEKTVLFKVPWATHMEDGTPISVKVGLTPEQANEVFEPYYQAAEHAGFRVIDLTKFPVFGEPLHQWGLAPYHYNLEVYEEMIRKLRELVRELYPEKASSLGTTSYVKTEVHRKFWETADHFVADCAEPNGTHTIKIGGLETHISFGGSPLNSEQKTIPVFFSGAVMNREELVPPFFSGFGISRQIGTPFIAVSDPMVDENPQINIAWYAGKAESNFQQDFAGLLKNLANKFDKDLLFIGGSAGGFAAIYYGLQVGSRAKVFAWNPQTDITRYIPQFVQKYLVEAGAPQEIFQENWTEDTLAWSRGKLDLRLPPSENLLDLKSSIILQNESDWHLEEHLSPWLATDTFLGSGSDGTKYYRSDQKHVFAVGNFSEGHDSLPHKMISQVIDGLLHDEDFSIEDFLKSSQVNNT